MKLCSFIAMLCFMLSSGAGAVSLRFKLDINSSGPSMYACDAGLKHVVPVQSRICYDRTTGSSCSPSVECTSDPASCNCVCTGTAAGGETRHDYLVAGYANWADNGQMPTGATSLSKIASPNNTWSSLFGGGTNSFGKVLTSLSFNLGSEQYGAEMYLDVCYRGPQIEYYRDYTNTDSPNHNFSASITVTNLADNTDYVALANLKTRAEVHCDLQGVGSYVYAADNNGEYDNWFNQQLTANATGNIIGGDTLQLTPVSALVTPQTTNTQLLSGWINLNNTRVPRYCKVRYYFAETAQTATNVLDRIRKWQHQKVQACTYTSIDEPGV